MIPTVVIDPGHGGRDPGAVGNGLQEKDATLSAALFTEEELVRGWEVNVILTRRKDEFVSIANRASLGRRATLFVSEHFDFNPSTGPRGFWTWRNTTVLPTTPAYQRVIHDAIYKRLGPLGVPDRGLRTANHDITRLPECPTVLVEYLFISNPQDAAIMRNQAYLRLMGKGTAEGIAEALNLKQKQVAPIQPIQPPQTDSWFRAIAGSWRDRTSAEAAVNRLKQAGYSAFLEVK